MTRNATISRTTKETDIRIAVDLDGAGSTDIDPGIGFFAPMPDAASGVPVIFPVRSKSVGFGEALYTTFPLPAPVAVVA